jgi:tRNA-splicing ligase RtcB (3'-phosphate/5'-hydroxy nucleic acid ligase)
VGFQELAGGKVKAWVDGVVVDEGAREQLENVAKLPFVWPHVAVMPDVHFGKGATIGSVIPTTSAIVPAAVGVDLGCGMSAVRTSLTAGDLPDSLAKLRREIEKAVPVGKTPGTDRGAWSNLPAHVGKIWSDELELGFLQICDKHPRLAKGNSANHLGTLGTGNHFVEICLDEADRVWVMLHSGSRGVGNRIGTYFIDKAKEEMIRWQIQLPDRDLAYLPEGSQYFDDYVEAVGWAQDFAKYNRAIMMEATLQAMRRVLPPFEARLEAVDCHHNYVAKEHHFGKDVWVTRKGAVRARVGDLGIIPGSMGAKSFIVAGKGNPVALASCSHGAGRAMSRGEAKRRFTEHDHAKQTAGVECRKDAGVVDEIPAAYKPIEAVMAAQSDLVEVVHTLRQVVCVKG